MSLFFDVMKTVSKNTSFNRTLSFLLSNRIA